MPTAIPARIPSRPRRDVRRRALTITIAGTTLLGFILTLGPSTSPSARPDTLSFSDLFKARPRTISTAQATEVRTRFAQGVTMLQMRQYDYALTAFHQVLKLAPELPEAHVNMGFALLGLKRPGDAASFFRTAIELRRDQMNAYYGLAIALEAGGDVPAAVGAMQSYLHLAKQDDPFRQNAEAALAEWRGRRQATGAQIIAPGPDAPPPNR